MDCRTFSLTLPSEPRMLSVARSFVEAVCQAHHFDQSLVHAFVLAAGEAVSNIVRHAHRHRADAPMEIQLQVAVDCVVLTFRDEGQPFDLARVPDLRPGELRLGGRGVYLMRTLMDELSCEPRGAGQVGNTLRMLKRLPAVARTA